MATGFKDVTAAIQAAIDQGLDGVQWHRGREVFIPYRANNGTDDGCEEAYVVLSDGNVIPLSLHFSGRLTSVTGYADARGPGRE